MSEPQEFDYEAVLKSCSMQGVALEQSFKQRQEAQQKYEETLEAYKKAKQGCLKTEDQNLILHTSFNEKLKIKNAINQLQVIPNTTVNSVHGQVLATRQEMSKDSDNFINEINNLMEKFQNLGNEFDEAAVLKNQSDCIHKIEVLESELKEDKNKYDQIKRYQIDNDYNAAIRSMKLAFCLNNYDPFQLRADIMEKKQCVQQLKKNIDFLKNRNHDLKVECDTFH